MQFYMFAWKYRANFIRRIATDRDHDIHFRRALSAKYVPAFRTVAICCMTFRLQMQQRIGMRLSARKAPRAIAAPSDSAEVITKRFGNNTSRGVTRA